MALFVERAQAARPGFALDEVTAPAVAEICRRLDGIPLAIELAAARLGSMNPTEIAGLLDERFRLLTGGRRSAVERHQTLRATVDWSYSLLSPVEQQVFDRLGVFAGSFDASAVTAVATGDGVATWDVLDAVASLVAKSMVTTNQAIEGATRYHLLETLRQYRETASTSGAMSTFGGGATRRTSRTSRIRPARASAVARSSRGAAGSMRSWTTSAPR